MVPIHSHIASGTVPYNLNTFTDGNFPYTEGKYPISPSESGLFYRSALPTAIVNPQDFSVWGNVKSSAVTVTTAAAKLTPNPLVGRRAIAINNINGSNSIFIGGADVTTSNGFTIAAGEKLTIDASSALDIYVIAGSSFAIRVLEIS